MQFHINKEIKLPDPIFDARYVTKSETNLVAAASLAGDIYLVEGDVIKSKIKKHHKGSPIRRIRFLNDGNMVTIAKTIKIHDLDNNKTCNTLKRDDGESTVFYSVKPFTTNIVGAGDDNGAVFVWDLRTPEKPIFSSHDCEQYISDIDGKYETRKLMLCSSGEGTLTAYDLRTNKMIEPQSELFEAGFQCIRYVDHLKKIVIGGEDGAIYVFNNNEWSHTSGKFAVNSDLHNRGKCSIDCIDILEDNSTFLTGCSDGRMRTVSLWPHKVLSEIKLCKRNSIESIHVCPKEGTNEIVVGGGNYLNYVSFEEKSDEDTSDDEESCQNANTPSAASTLSDDYVDEDDEQSDNTGLPASESEEKRKAKRSQNKNKKFKGDERPSEDDQDDYLNVFKK